MGKEYLVEGAKLMCVSGCNITTLQIPEGHGYTSGGKKKANCKDCIACKNIPYFEGCRKNEETHLCEGYMLLAEKWENIGGSSSKAEKIDGHEALTMDSILLCKKGGIIMPLTSGQGYDEKVNWGAFMKRFVNAMRWAAGKNMLCHIFGGDPINLNTGNFIYEKEDLIIPGITQLSFHIFYNAMEKGDEGCLGTGWHHNYDTHIEEKNNGKFISVCMSDGREIPYQQTIGDIYTPVFGDKGVLVKKENETSYCSGEGEEHVFNPDGLLIMKKDKDGNTDLFFYNQKKQLTKVVGANGGELAYSYNKEGKLVYIKDHAGREVHLQYRYGKLWKFINTEGDTYTYSYNENGKLDCIITPRGIEGVRNEYDAADRVVKQIMPDGGIIELKYDDENMRTYMKEQNGNMIIYESDDRFRNIKNIYEDGEEIFEYNEKNQRTLFIDKKGNKTKYRYDKNGNLTEIKDALGYKICMEYNQNNQVLSYKQKNGSTILNIYNENGKLVERKDSIGNSKYIKYDKAGRPFCFIQEDMSEINLLYDKRGNINVITDSMGNQFKYEYDILNRIISATDGNGNITKFLYDKRNNIIESINSLGYKKKYIRDQNENIIQIIDYDNSSINFFYDNSNRIERAENKENISIRFVYDKVGNLVEEIFPNGSKRNYVYDKFKHLIEYKDEMGYIKKYGYDVNGNCIKSIGPDGAVTSFSYDALNRVTSITEPDGATSFYEYNAQGQRTKITFPGGITEETEYDVCGRIKTQKDIYGNITEYVYNALGLPKSIINNNGIKTDFDYYPGGLLKKIHYPNGTSEKFSYDGNGNIIEKCNQEGYSLAYEYDAVGRIVKIASSIGERIEYEYDAVGNVIALTDGNKNIRKYEYTPTGRINAVEEADGSKNLYCYDCMGKLISVEQRAKETDEWVQFNEAVMLNENQKHITFYERDFSGRMTAKTDSHGNRDEYSYDCYGRIIKTKDREGFDTLYSYDLMGNTKNIKHADGKKVEYEYNALRQLVQIKDWLGITSIEPDAYGRAVKITDHNNNSVSYEYGLSGEQKAIIYPEGTKVEYSYDECLRLVRLHSNEEDIRYQYNENGYLNKKILPGEIYSEYEYDKAGRISKILNMDNKGVLDELSYTYDAVGNKTTMHKERRGMTQWNGDYKYFYDNCNRLTSVIKDGNPIHKYSYDRYGNRTYMETEDKSITFHYNTLNQLVSSQGSLNRGYSYDRRGNLINVTENERLIASYGYDAANHISFYHGENNKFAAYIYNGMGQRVGKEVGQDSENRRITIYKDEYILDLTKGHHNLLQEKRGEDLKSYIWDEGPVAVESAVGSQYYLRDDLDTPIRLLYYNGNLSEAYDFDEFGNQQYGEWESNQPFGFTGYYKDSVSGNYFAQAREYIPYEGRFAGADVFGGSLGIPASLNGYSYCFHNPLIFWDPLGYYTSVEGREAHDILQHVFKKTFPLTGETEYKVKHYPYSITGVGYIDIYIQNKGNGPDEVYEIKPISQYQGNPNPNTNGVRQRQGYIQALRYDGIDVNPIGNSFNPNGLTVESQIHKEKAIKYYTFPDRPGMIYWGYVNKPKQEPYANEKDKEKQEDDDLDIGESAEEVLDIAAITGGIAAAGWVLIQLIITAFRWFCGDYGYVPTFACVTCQ